VAKAVLHTAGDAGSCGAACRRVIAAASNPDKRVIDAIAVSSRTSAQGSEFR
jgi:hypothetical protein